MNLPYTHNTTPIKWTNTTILEEEINNKFVNNRDFNIENLVLFGEVTPYSYIPLKTHITDKGEFKVEDSVNNIGINLFIGSNRQFLHKRVYMEEDSYKLELDEYFKTAWNKDKFIIFQNGYLMNSNVFTYIIPTFNNDYLKKIIYSTVKFSKDSRIDIYYIESKDNFNQLPISRDIYLSAIKHTAIRNNERVIEIPSNYKSFFIFNRNGEYLDEGTDYVISIDRKYITLREENSLTLANVDYIIFAFPHLAKEVDYIENIEEDISSIVDGSPYFRYAYSTQSEENESGLVRFIPMFSDYYLTKKNFLLFGNGQFIQSNRYEINSNDSIIFLNEEDKIVSSSTNYTMVIFDDNTSHDDMQIPMEYYILPIECNDTNSIKIEENIDPKYTSFIIFKDNYLITNYEYNKDLDKIYFKENISGTIYIIYLSSIINNTNQEALLKVDNFACNRYGSMGTPLPEGYSTINKDTTLLYLNGAFLEPNLYEIRDGRIYLDQSFYMDDRGNPISLEGYEYSLINLMSSFKKDAAKLNEEEIENIKTKQKDIEENYEDSAYLFSRSSIRSTNRGAIVFEDEFNDYQLTKKNILLYSNGGTFIDPSRYEIVDNNRIFMLSDYDQDKVLYTKYNMIVFNDKKKDDRYNPPNILIKQVIATEDNQQVFEIPKVNRRFRSFILYRGSVFLNKDYRYAIEDDKVILHEESISKGRCLTFIFLDAYSRLGQENLFIQGTFECKVNQATKIPNNFLTTRFNKDNMILMLNGLYLSSNKYTINENNEILLDGYISLDELENHTYTILYITSIPTAIREYDYDLPTISAAPIKENDNLASATWTYSYSNNTNRKIVSFSPIFNSYALTKNNFLLFSGNKWIHPKEYEVYSNSLIIFDRDISDACTMAIFSDVIEREFSKAPIISKVIDVVVEDNIIDIPYLGEYYESFIIFSNGKLVDNYKIDWYNKKIYIKEDIKDHMLKPIYSFVFLYSHMNASQQILFYQESFKYSDNCKVPNSVFSPNVSSMYSLLFVDGEYKSRFEYSIDSEGILNISNVEDNTKITVVYLVSLLDEDYSEEYEIIRPAIDIEEGINLQYSYSIELENKKDSSGIVSFNPRYTHSELNKNNFMLFANGTWIDPDRYNILTNAMLSFEYWQDRKHSAWTHYTMIIPNEDSTPINLTLYQIKASEDKQRKFKLPILDEHATYLIFLGSLLIPITDDRIYITEDNHLIFVEEEDYVEKDRCLSFIIINDINKEDRYYPMFVQETFEAELDPSRGTLIPSDWYEYEKNMIVFLGGMYLDKFRYEIKDHKIYLLDDFSMLDNPYSTGFIRRRSYTLVYILSQVLDDYEKKPIDIVPIEEEEKERILPKDDELDYSSYYFASFTSNLNSRNGYVEYLDSFESFTLDKSNFMLFANSTWIDPKRYNIIDNHTLEFIDDKDKKHSEWTHYTMLFPFSQNSYNIYKDAYIKPSFKIVERITNEDTNELDLPVVDSDYESLLIFRNSLILPINEEDRFVIDDNNHKFMILNKEDWIPKNTTVSFIFFRSTTNTDQKLLLVQESFRCLGLKTKLPNSLFRYEDQKFNKSRMLLYLNGTFVVPERYILHNNTIYLVDNINLKGDHIFTIVYLDIVDNEDTNIETNTIDKTYEEGLDDIVFEVYTAKGTAV